MKYIYLQVSSYKTKSKIHITFKNIETLLKYLNNPENQHLMIIKEFTDSCGNLTGFLVKEENNE